MPIKLVTLLITSLPIVLMSSLSSLLYFLSRSYILNSSLNAFISRISRLLFFSIEALEMVRFYFCKLLKELFSREGTSFPDLKFKPTLL